MEENNSNLLICPDCLRPAEWCENKEIYGQNYGKSYMVWLCRKCKTYVGCHNNTKNPKGTLANAEMRKWRIKAHEHVDAYWLNAKDRKAARNYVYKKLSEYFGFVVHIGEQDVPGCKSIITAVYTVLANDNHLKSL